MPARIEIKDADKGTFAALFSTFDVVDKDGDVTHPGAFEEGKRVPVSSYGHTSWEGALPVGAATIRQTRTEAIAEGKFYLDTPHGADTWSTLKAMQDDGIPSEWSYGFDARDYSFGDFEGQSVRFLKAVDVHEVSPVLLGAGVGTRTLDVKSHRPAPGVPSQPTGYRGGLPPHETAVTDERWNPFEAMKSLGIGASIADLRAAHAWFDPTGDPERKASYHFLHHGPSGAANVRACLLGIAALNGARGPQIPEAAKSEVYDHLASHLRDADRAVPDLKSRNGTLKLRDQAMVVLADLTTLNGRIAEVGASRALKSEQGLTGANRELMSWISDEVKALLSILDTPDENIAREYARWIRLTNGM
jgi:HK97 family phage prohead protease